MHESRLFGHEPSPEGIAQYLNLRFAGGDSAYEELDRIRSIPFPIVVDFNGVLVTERTPNTPYKANPQAEHALQQLRQTGTVFVVSSAYDWYEVHDTLRDNGLLHPDMIIMACPNYEFLTDWAPCEEGEEVIEEYARMVDVPADDFMNPAARKNLAPLFGKPFEVPILDDYDMAVENNPMMYGLLIQSYKGEDKVEKQTPHNSLPPVFVYAEPLLLSEAAAKVVEYRTSLDF